MCLLKNLIVAAGLLVGLVPIVARAQRASIPPFPIVADGQQYQITLGPNERLVKELSVYFVSTGNISTAVEVKVEGPVGLRGSVVGGFLGSRDAAQVVSEPRNLRPIRSRLTMSRDAKDFGLTPFSGDPRGGSAYVWYHLQKDNCSGSRSDRYVSLIKLDLSRLDASLFDLTFTVRIAVKEFSFNRPMVSSIKPASDGKYRGEPILLMASISSDEYVNIVRWRNKRIVQTRRIPVVKYVGYKGYRLSLARIRSVLDGQKSTFELSNGGDIYGVCFTAAARRQSANGYPAPR